MNIYDLNQSYYLRLDIEDVLKKIDILYEVKIGDVENEFVPKTLVSNKFSWVSDECQSAFNKIVPAIKSLTKDMYAILESIYKSNKGKFDKLKLEEKYFGLKELRLLNNKFKHYFDTEPKVSLMALTLIQPPMSHQIDASINYQYKDGTFKSIRFAELVKCFLLILEDLKIVTINRV
ncbi:MAG TPA: hypothetical protein VK718_09170 [Ferruginibacter sp.]|jgi:hypothetical protein|nr:hypothetical protein [Ferruginibacter sp.]